MSSIVLITNNFAEEQFIRTHLADKEYGDLFSIQDISTVFQCISQNQPYLILVDAYLTQRDSLELLSEYYTLFSDYEIPILLMVAEGDETLKEQGLALGVNDIISKPIKPYELCARVKNFLANQKKIKHVLDKNQFLERIVQQYTVQLNNTHLETLQRLERAAAFKDNDTGEHVKRVSMYSTLIAGALNLPAEQVELIMQTSPMHDVGKIGITDSILLKPGKLTEREMEIMQQHTVIGTEIFLTLEETRQERRSDTRLLLDLVEEQKSPLFRTAALITLTHHEKWDGKGYPQQLSGSDIPIEGRIVAVADVFDALTTVRPYKKAFSLEKAVEMMTALRGTHFDPDVLDAFFSFTDVLYEVQALYPEEQKTADIVDQTVQ